MYIPRVLACLSHVTSSPYKQCGAFSSSTNSIAMKAELFCVDKHDTLHLPHLLGDISLHASHHHYVYHIIIAWIRNKRDTLRLHHLHTVSIIHYKRDKAYIDISLCYTHTHTHIHTRKRTRAHTLHLCIHILICIRDICLLPVRILHILPFVLEFIRFRVSGPNLGLGFGFKCPKALRAYPWVWVSSLGSNPF